MKIFDGEYEYFHKSYQVKLHAQWKCNRTSRGTGAALAAPPCCAGALGDEVGTEPPPPGPQVTWSPYACRISSLQIGHVRCSRSHWSMQFLWYSCLCGTRKRDFAINDIELDRESWISGESRDSGCDACESNTRKVLIKSIGNLLCFT